MKLNCWSNARCYIPRTICHTTFELQFTGIRSPSPSVKQSTEQISHLLFDSPVLLTWAASRNAVLFAIQITDCALLPTSQWKRSAQVISLVWDVQRLSTHTSTFLWLHSLGSALRGHDHPRSVHFIIVVCPNNPSPVEFSCTQCNKGTRGMCIILEGSYQLWEGWNEAWLCMYRSTSQGGFATVNNKEHFCIVQKGTK